jgi:hypothetical protein
MVHMFDPVRTISADVMPYLLEMGKSSTYYTTAVRIQKLPPIG